MDNKTCFFIGSRNTSYSLKESLAEAVEKHITEYNVINFIVGHYGWFDALAREVLIEAKKQHNHIKLYLLTPYLFDQNREASAEFSGTFYPEGLEFVPRRFAIIQANRYMVKHSDYLIAHPGISNSRDIVEYAQRQEKKGLIKVTII